MWGVLTLMRLMPLESQALAEDVVDIGTQTQLFLDDFIIDRQQGLIRRLNQLVKHLANPIISPENPWEGQSMIPHAVVYDDSQQRFKIWYSCIDVQWDPRVVRNQTAYAFSKDGISWKKPVLGQVAYQDSKRNNLLKRVVFGEKVQPPAAGKARQSLGNGPKVFLDHHADHPSRRFKALGYGRPSDASPVGICVATSADGLNWVAAG